VSPGPVAAAAVVSSLVVGILIGARPHLGIGLLVALIYAPLVFVNLRIGIAVYVVLIFLNTWTTLRFAPTAASILILFGWLGSMRERGEWAKLVVTRRMLIIGVAFFAWLTLSALWAASASHVLSEVWYWYVVGLGALIVMTTFDTRGGLQLVLGAFVAGAVASVIVAFLGGANAEGEGRLATGVGDPNDLAAGIVPAIMISFGLLTTIKSPLKRWPLIASICILAAGLAGTESRGGILGLMVALALACVVFRERRAQMVAGLGVAVTVLAIALTITPGAWGRVTNFGGGGSGRTDLWHVAWRISQDHPVAGVGLNNFRTVSRDYVRRPGTLQYVSLIVDGPHLVHNQYLERLAENGVIGLALFLALALGALAAARRAALNFDRRGERTLANLSRWVLVGTAGMLTAAFFLSIGNDPRQWVLLAFGPTALALSRRDSRLVES
jgi:O-antigen ligase